MTLFFFSYFYLLKKSEIYFTKMHQSFLSPCQNYLDPVINYLVLEGAVFIVPVSCWEKGPEANLTVDICNDHPNICKIYFVI